ncbi:MAG: hypothetical protein ACTSU2_04180 [Promethearchaeota archaeon]
MLAENDQEFYNYIFRTLLERDKVCYIQNYDQKKKPFLGVLLNPFEFLVFSEHLNKNFIVEVVGNYYPIKRRVPGEAMEQVIYDILGEISKKEEQRHIELEHTIIWQNIFKGEFTSILVFIYLFRDLIAEREFNKRMGDRASYFKIMVDYKEIIKNEEMSGALCVIPAKDYLEYVNLNKIPITNIHLKKGDGKKYLSPITEFIPDIKI